MGLLAEYEKELTACGERYRAAQTEIARLSKECDELRDVVAVLVNAVMPIVHYGKDQVFGHTDDLDRIVLGLQARQIRYACKAVERAINTEQS